MNLDKLTHTGHFDALEKTYLKAREKEGRVLPDARVKKLPVVDKNEALYSEWRRRAASLQKVTAFLHARKEVIDILDFGCGNGWMSNALFQEHYLVTGLDINKKEIEQASRLFGEPGLRFVLADIFEKPDIGTFDVVVVSAVLQYFEHVDKLISVLQSYLKPNGVILLSDTPFYSDSELEKAAFRSKKYYSDLGVPEMSSFYFHHSQHLLTFYTSIVVYRPTWWTKLKHKWGFVQPAFGIYAIEK